jgi:putative membrane-bound dehydrogenase-like protein
MTCLRTVISFRIVLVLLLGTAAPAWAAKPLRVFIRASEKTHGPGAHDYPRFLRDWTALLNERGANATGAMRFPTESELRQTDVVILYASDGANVEPADRRNLESYLRAGGGLVVLHDGLCGQDPEWFKGVAGGAKKHGTTNWQTGRVRLEFSSAPHPITDGIANFELNDELFYDLHLAPETQVLATTVRTIKGKEKDKDTKEVVPQMWVYEKRRGRVFVSNQGHLDATFHLPHYRGLLLRAIAWAGRREINSLVTPVESAHFRYPHGGPTPPEKAAARIEVNPEFNLSLVASEPLVVNPLYVDWDARGRMWVAIAPEPAGQPVRGRSRDSIVLLEDTNGDGRMDRRSVFSDGLNHPTSFVFWQDGLIVAQASDILFLRDRNNDGRSERRQVLFTGFNASDPRGAINNLRWGLDGWIYGCQGASGKDSTNIVDARGRKFGKIDNGIFRFRPDGSAIEQVSAFTGNTWGIDFSDEGELFFSKAAGPHINHVVMPERYLVKGNMGKTVGEKGIEDHQKINALLSDGTQTSGAAASTAVFTAAAGCTIYQGGIWPEKYHGSSFVCEPTAHVVHEDVINRAETPTFEATRRDTDEFIAANDSWFRPIHTGVGPDGQMYVLDCYGQAPVESEAPRKTASRANPGVGPNPDDEHGRIYRITHKQQRRVPSFALDRAPSTELVHALQHPNLWVRMTAQRLLTERQDRSVVPDLSALLRTNRFVHVRLHALWTLHHLNALAETNLVAGLKDEHPSVMNNALQVVAELRAPPSSNVTAAVIKQVKGNTERTRLLALFALASSPPSSDTIAAVHKLFPDLKDGWAKSAVLGIARQAPTNFIRASFASDKADSYTELVQLLTEEFLENKDRARAEWVLRHTARQTKVSSKIRVAVIDAFNKHLDDYSLPFNSNVDAAIAGLLDTDSKTTRIAMFPLAIRYEAQGTYGAHLAKIRKSLLAELENPKAKDDERNAHLTSLVKVPALQKDVIATVDEVLTDGAPDAVERHMVNEIGALRQPEVADVLIRNFHRLKLDARLIAFSHLVKRPERAEALLHALETKEIRLSELTVYGANRLRTHSDKRVAQDAARVLDALEGPRERDKKRLISQFENALREPVDLANGREMFIRNCTICHKFNDKGRHIGPELTGVGLHGPSVILRHVLEPNRVVEPNFIAYNLITKRGDHYVGMIKADTKDSVTLRNLEGDITVKRADIQSFTSSGLSLMPDGLEALGEANVRDILGYIIARTPKGYRSIDLTSAFTADSAHGLFASRTDAPSLVFKQFGVVMVDDIPFNIANPSATTGGRNLIVLQGGEGYAQSFPRRVEFKVDLAARKFYVLGGVAGWGFPYGPPEGHNVPAARATLVYDDGQTEGITWKNGEQFADYMRPHEVPGSKAVADLTTTGQLRWFSFSPARKHKISSITLESFGNHLAPAFVAVTAQVDP